MKYSKKFTPEKYRAALNDLQVVHELGLTVKFGSIIEKHNLPYATKGGLIPNLAGVDLDKEFDRLFNVQDKFLKALNAKSNGNGKAWYKVTKSRIQDLEKENAELRAKLAEKE